MTIADVAPTELGPLPPHDGLSGARLRLFETALRVFGERGYHAVSVRDLMNELGQHSGALYFHVASKEDLLFELVNIGLASHRDRLQDALLDAGRDPVDQARAVVEAHVRAHLDYPELARVTTREVQALSGERLAVALTLRAENARLLADVVDRGVRRGVFHVNDPTLAVLAIGSMGVRAVEWWTPDSPHTKDHVARTYADFALKVLL